MPSGQIIHAWNPGNEVIVKCEFIQRVAASFACLIYIENFGRTLVAIM